MSLDKKLIVKNRKGINNMLGVNSYKKNKIDNRWFYEGDGIKIGTSQKLNSFDLRVFEAINNRFTESVGNSTDKNIIELNNKRKITITNDYLLEVFGGSSDSTRDDLKKKFVKSCKKWQSVTLDVKRDKGANNEIIDDSLSFIDRVTTGRGYINVHIAMSLAEYIQNGFLTYLPGTILQLSNKYDFAIAKHLVVHQRQGNESIKVDTLINKIPGLVDVRAGKKNPSRVYEHINNALINMVDYGVLESYEYKNNKLSETRKDYCDNYQLLKGDTIIYKIK